MIYPGVMGKGPSPFILQRNWWQANCYRASMTFWKENQHYFKVPFKTTQQWVTSSIVSSEVRCKYSIVRFSLSNSLIWQFQLCTLYNNRAQRFACPGQVKLERGKWYLKTTCSGDNLNQTTGETGSLNNYSWALYVKIIHLTGQVEF